MSNGVFVVNEQKVSSWVWLRWLYIHTHTPHDFKHYVWPPPLKAFITGKGNSTSVPWPTKGKKRKGKKHWSVYMWFMRTSSLTQTPALKPDIHFKALPSPVLTSKIRYAVKHCSPSSSLLLQQFNACMTQFTTFHYNINTNTWNRLFYFLFRKKSVENAHRNVLYQLEFLTDYLNQNHFTSIIFFFVIFDTILPVLLNFANKNIKTKQNC